MDKKQYKTHDTAWMYFPHQDIVREVILKEPMFTPGIWMILYNYIHDGKPTDFITIVSEDELYPTMEEAVNARLKEYSAQLMAEAYEWEHVPTNKRVINKDK